MSVELAGWMLVTKPESSHQHSICFRLIGSEHCFKTTQPRLTPSVTANVCLYQLIDWWCNTHGHPGYKLSIAGVQQADRQADDDDTLLH